MCGKLDGPVFPEQMIVTNLAKKLSAFTQSKGSSPCSQKPTTDPNLNQH
jgi:hypothetical protein